MRRWSARVHGSRRSYRARVTINNSSRAVRLNRALGLIARRSGNAQSSRVVATARKVSMTGHTASSENTLERDRCSTGNEKNRLLIRRSLDRPVCTSHESHEVLNGPRTQIAQTVIPKSIYAFSVTKKRPPKSTITCLLHTMCNGLFVTNRIVRISVICLKDKILRSACTVEHGARTFRKKLAGTQNGLGWIIIGPFLLNTRISVSSYKYQLVPTWTRFRQVVESLYL